MMKIRFGNGVVSVPDDATKSIKTEDMIVFLNSDGMPVQAHKLLRDVESRRAGRKVKNDEVVEVEPKLLHTAWTLYLKHRRIDFSLSEEEHTNVTQLVSWSRLVYELLRSQIPPLTMADV